MTELQAVAEAVGLFPPDVYSLNPVERERISNVDCNGSTLLSKACESGSANTVLSFLLAGADPNQNTADGSVPLLIAAREGHVTVAKLLVAAGADLDHRAHSTMHLVADGIGPTALFVAAESNHVEYAEFLLEAGANPNRRTKSGIPPIYIAAVRGHVELARLLADHGADVSAKVASCDEGEHECATKPNSTFAKHTCFRCPIGAAMFLGHARTAAMLIRAHPNSEDAYQESKCPLSTNEGLTKQQQKLRIASLNTVAKAEGLFPVTYFDNDFEGYMAFCRRFMTEEYTPLSLACEMGWQNTVLSFLLAGADPNQNTADGSVPLIIAAREGHVTVAKLLVAAGANLNYRTESTLHPKVHAAGLTALVVATQKKQFKVAKFLLEAGADPNRQANCGVTPLYAAAIVNNIALTRILLRHGANISTKVSPAEHEKTELKLSQMFEGDKCVRSPVGAAMSLGHNGVASMISSHLRPYPQLDDYTCIDRGVADAGEIGEFSRFSVKLPTTQIREQRKQQLVKLISEFMLDHFESKSPRAFLAALGFLICLAPVLGGLALYVLCSAVAFTCFALYKKSCATSLKLLKKESTLLKEQTKHEREALSLIEKTRKNERRAAVADLRKAEEEERKTRLMQMQSKLASPKSPAQHQTHDEGNGTGALQTTKRSATAKARTTKRQTEHQRIQELILYRQALRARGFRLLK
jgi:ankyrin repeat protein